MSTEEDTELRDLVAQTLEINGCLPKLRAELRASIFLALDEDVKLQKSQPLLNETIKSHLDTQEGQNMFCLVREFLEYFGLDFTISVYDPESYLGTKYHYRGRTKIVEDLSIPELKDDSVPLLLQLIRIAQLKTKNQAQSFDILCQIQNKGNQEESYLDQCNKNCDVTNISINSDISLSEDLKLSESNFEDNNMNGVNDNSGKDCIASKINILNATFDISTDCINANITDKVKSIDELAGSPSSIDTSKSDEINDGRGSISEDKSHSISSESEFSSPILKDKSHSKFETNYDKLKLSPQKGEKLKSKSNLSSLADLHPLQLNKSHTDSVLLPSLFCNKDFKEKKEVDKTFDMEPLDNYEEDFMSDSEINKSTNSSKNCDELKTSSISDTNKCSNYSKKVSSSSSDFNQNQNLLKGKTEALLSHINACENNFTITNNSKTSVTSDDALNRNIDDILNSPTSN